jgi:hypothetical protein
MLQIQVRDFGLSLHNAPRRLGQGAHMSSVALITSISTESPSSARRRPTTISVIFSVKPSEYPAP